MLSCLAHVQREEQTPHLGDHPGLHSGELIPPAPLDAATLREDQRRENKGRHETSPSTGWGSQEKYTQSHEERQPVAAAVTGWSA